MPEEEEDLYALLGLEEGAPQEEVKRSYQRLALLHHPDRGGGSHEAFMAVSRAWEVLGRADARREYDAGRRQRRAAAVDAVADAAWAAARWQDLAEGDGGQRTLECRCGGEFVAWEEDVRAACQDGADEILINCDTCSLCLRVLVDSEKERAEGDIERIRDT